MAAQADRQQLTAIMSDFQPIETQMQGSIRKGNWLLRINTKRN